jgi:hypothetical protein
LSSPTVSVPVLAESIGVELDSSKVRDTVRLLERPDPVGDAASAGLTA